MLQQQDCGQLPGYATAKWDAPVIPDGAMDAEGGQGSDPGPREGPNSLWQVPGSLACGSASGMTGVGSYAVRFTSMRLAFGSTVAASGLGRLTVSTPSLNAADTLSGSTSKGTVVVRWNAP